jgi:hypothetical protein
MAIQSASEFEAVVNHVLIKIEKALNERGSVPTLETAARDLKAIFAAARTPAKLKAQRALLEKTTDTLNGELSDDATLLDQLWDLADYIDYRV